MYLGRKIRLFVPSAYLAPEGWRSQPEGSQWSHEVWKVVRPRCIRYFLSQRTENPVLSTILGSKVNFSFGMKNGCFCSWRSGNWYQTWSYARGPAQPASRAFQITSNINFQPLKCKKIRFFMRGGKSHFYAPKLKRKIRILRPPW